MNALTVLYSLALAAGSVGLVGLSFFVYILAKAPGKVGTHEN